MSTVARTPRTLLGAAALAAAAVLLLVGLARRSPLRPGPDPWQVTALVLLGAVLVGWDAATRRRARVSRAALARDPALPVVLSGEDLGGMPLGDVAWADPRVRTGWRRLLVRALWPVVAAVVVALAVALPLRTHAAESERLAQTGVRVVGHVDASRWAFEGRGGRAVVDVVYRVGRRDLVASVAGPPPGLAPRGLPVALRVDPQRPEVARAEGYPRRTSALEWWTTLGGLAVVALLALGAVALARSLDLRRRLQARPWVAADLVAVPHGGSQALLLTTSTVRAAAHTLPRRTRAEQLPGSGRVGVLGGHGRSVLAHLPDGTLVPLVLPRTAVEGRRWLRALGGPGPAAGPVTETATVEGSGPTEHGHEEVRPDPLGAQVPGGEA